MDSAIAGYVAAAIGVPLVFLLLRKSFPRLSEYENPTRSLDDLRKEYAKWEMFLGLCFILLTIATGYIWWVLFQWLGSLTAIRFKDAVFYVAPARLAWAIPALFSGMGTGGYLADKILNISLKERYAEYTLYQNVKYKINTKKLTVPTFAFLAFSPLIIIFLFLNWHAVFTSDQIIVKPLFAFSEKRFKYSDVTSIRTAPSLIAPNGNVVHRREYVIRFANGEVWTTNNSPADLTSYQKDQIAQFVSRASAVQIAELDVLSRAEL